ncbi:MAG: ribbon-helix-helix protein, CopG family [Polyangiaceae bacterium]
MLGVRLDPRLDRLLSALARRRRTTKSELAREAIQRYLTEADLAARAKEQSQRASRKAAPDEIEHDDRGWTT